MRIPPGVGLKAAGGVDKPAVCRGFRRESPYKNPPTVGRGMVFGRVRFGLRELILGRFKEGFETFIT